MLPSTEVSLEGLYRRHSFSWDSLPTYFFDGPHLGNGLLGTVLHRRDPKRGDARELLWEFNRSDVVDTGYYQAEGYVWTRIGIGKMILRTRGEILTSRFHLDLWDATLTGEVETTCGVLQLRSFIHAIKPIFWLEVYAEGEEDGHEFGFGADPSGPVIDFGRVDIEETATIEPRNPPSSCETYNGIHIHRQRLHCEEREFAVSWGESRQGRKTFYCATIEYSHPQEITGAFNGQEEIEHALQGGIDVAWESHRQWWHAHYEAGSRLWLNDQITEAFYARQHYVWGCIARENGHMIDLIGPWYCHTIWRAVWWNLNTQMMYLPLAACNRPNLVKPLERTLWRERENLRRNAPSQWQHDSFAIGRGSGYDCYSPLDFNVQPDAASQTSDRDAGKLEAGNLVWALHPLYMTWRLEQDEHSAREHLYPLLKEATHLYFHLLERGADGLYHLPQTFSPEYKGARDCSYDLALLRWALRVLLELNNALQQNDSESPHWQHVLEKLAPLAQDSQMGILIGQDVALTESHRHFSHLLSYWPLRISPPDELLRRTLEHWLSLSDALAGYSYSVASACYALLGEGDTALKWLHALIAPAGPLSKTTLYREAGLCLETPLLTMETIHQMLLQEREDVLILFPAVAQSWRDVTFEDLRVAGAFRVSATREDGRTITVKVESDKGGTCRVQLPQGQWRCSIHDRHANILQLETLLEIESAPEDTNLGSLDEATPALDRTPYDVWRVTLPLGGSALWTSTNTVTPDVITPNSLGA
jgi:hypothetical protein